MCLTPRSNNERKDRPTDCRHNTGYADAFCRYCRLMNPIGEIIKRRKQWIDFANVARPFGNICSLADLLPWRFVPRHPRVALVSNIVSTACLFWLIGSIGVRRARFSVFRRYVPPATPGRDIILNADDGMRIAGTWWPGAGVSSPGLVIVHGIGACRRSVAANAAWFAGQGLSVLAIDLRGHGGSGPALHSFGWFESRDVHAAFRWLKRRQRGAPVAVLGISMGGAAALIGPAGPVPADALILQAVFTTLRETLRCRMALVVGRLVASAVEPFLSMQTWWRVGVWPSAISPLAAMPNVTCPVLVIGGDADGFVPATQTRALYRAAYRAPRSLWIAPCIRHHNDIADASSASYRAHVLHFLNTHLVGGATQSIGNPFDR